MPAGTLGKVLICPLQHWIKETYKANVPIRTVTNPERSNLLGCITEYKCITFRVTM